MPQVSTLAPEAPVTESEMSTHAPEVLTSNHEMSVMNPETFITEREVPIFDPEVQSTDLEITNVEECLKYIAGGAVGLVSALLVCIVFILFKRLVSLKIQ